MEIEKRNKLNENSKIYNPYNKYDISIKIETLKALIKGWKIL